MFLFKTGIAGNRWTALLDALAEDKSEYAEAPEESEHVFIASQIFEIVCDREISEDPEEAVSGMALYKHELKEYGKIYLCMPSNRFLELVSCAGFKIAPNTLSATMTELGMKCKATPRIGYGGRQLRSWCFIPEAVLSQKGDDGK